MKQLFFLVIITFLFPINRSASAENHLKSNINFMSASSGYSQLNIPSVFFTGFFNKKKNLRDSVITSMEKRWFDTKKMIEQDNYYEAIRSIKNIIVNIDTYSLYCKKRRNSPKIFLDTAQLLLGNCVLLDSLKPVISQVNLLSDSLPLSADDLTIQRRNELIVLRDRCKNAVNEIVDSKPERKGAIRFGLRKSIIRINSFDSLLNVVYDQNRLEFSVKNRFYYNRATEKNDTSMIRNFINDCGYYQVDKEWCTRARMILGEIDTSSKISTESQVPKKLSDKELMKIEYQQAMVSSRIDLLEQYLAKYGKKKIKKSESKIDSIKTVLKTVNEEIEAEAAYNKSYPLYANADLNKLNISITGLSEIVQQKYTEAIENNRESLHNISGIRFPADIQINYASSNPVLLISSYINCKKDVKVENTDRGTTVYSVNGVPQLMQYLNTLKKTTSESVKDAYQKKNINYAAYAVRLYKTSNEYITFYGKESSKELLFYDFFDITMDQQKDVRISNALSHVIEILSTEGSREEIMVRKFFSDN